MVDKDNKLKYLMRRTYYVKYVFGGKMNHYDGEEYKLDEINIYEINEISLDIPDEVIENLSKEYRIKKLEQKR